MFNLFFKHLTGKDAPTLSTLNAFLKLNPEYSMVDPKSVPNPRPEPPKGGRKTILLTSVQLPPDKKARQEAAPKPPKPAPKKQRTQSESKEVVAPPVATLAPTTFDIRKNVRKALADCLLKRVEAHREEFPEINSETVDALVSKIETELYSRFDKMVNQKYKTRYRSIVFNIRDAKNLGLFRKVCNR